MSITGPDPIWATSHIAMFSEFCESEGEREVSGKRWEFLGPSTGIVEAEKTYSSR